LKEHAESKQKYGMTFHIVSGIKVVLNKFKNYTERTTKHMAFPVVDNHFFDRFDFW